MTHTPENWKCSCHDVVLGNCPTHREEVEKIVSESELKKNEHTPTPWNVSTTSNDRGRKVLLSHDVQVASVNDEADAEFIVKAVNSHAELVEALNIIQNSGQIDAKMFAYIDSVIAKAEGK